MILAGWSENNRKNEVLVSKRKLLTSIFLLCLIFGFKDIIFPKNGKKFQFNEKKNFIELRAVIVEYFHKNILK